MNKIYYTIIWLILSFHATFADNTSGIFWDSITWDELRNWNIHIDNIPNMIKSLIDFFMWIAGTIAIIFIIIWAYKILLWWLEWDKTKWKDTIIMALWWFALASLSWFIIKFIIDNFS